eukprot:TRINITY_DN1394_c1_g1_i1.p2 TRINITY_DN1394_c1_g1~~TRINITY_DN1394_c1_g1_i1.p2  ORF type:complete len:334 (+),score=124.94 TRINITY_DN1394_c1_g1_i1:82-1083(+)
MAGCRGVLQGSAAHVSSEGLSAEAELRRVAAENDRLARVADELQVQLAESSRLRGLMADELVRLQGCLDASDAAGQELEHEVESLSALLGAAEAEVCTLRAAADPGAECPRTPVRGNEGDDQELQRLRREVGLLRAERDRLLAERPVSAQLAEVTARLGHRLDSSEAEIVRHEAERAAAEREARRGLRTAAERVLSLARSVRCLREGGAAAASVRCDAPPPDAAEWDSAAAALRAAAGLNPPDPGDGGAEHTDALRAVAAAAERWLHSCDDPGSPPDSLRMRQLRDETAAALRAASPGKARRQAPAAELARALCRVCCLAERDAAAACAATAG